MLEVNKLPTTNSKTRTTFLIDEQKGLGSGSTLKDSKDRNLAFSSAIPAFVTLYCRDWPKFTAIFQRKPLPLLITQSPQLLSLRILSKPLLNLSLLFYQEKKGFLPKLSLFLSISRCARKILVTELIEFFHSYQIFLHQKERISPIKIWRPVSFINWVERKNHDLSESNLEKRNPPSLHLLLLLQKKPKNSNGALERRKQIQAS